MTPSPAPSDWPSWQSGLHRPERSPCQGDAALPMMCFCFVFRNSWYIDVKQSNTYVKYWNIIYIVGLDRCPYHMHSSRSILCKHKECSSDNDTMFHSVPILCACMRMLRQCTNELTSLVVKPGDSRSPQGSQPLRDEGQTLWTFPSLPVAWWLNSDLAGSGRPQVEPRCFQEWMDGYQDESILATTAITCSHFPMRRLVRIRYSYGCSASSIRMRKHCPHLLENFFAPSGAKPPMLLCHRRSRSSLAQPGRQRAPNKVERCCRKLMHERWLHQEQWNPTTWCWCLTSTSEVKPVLK